MSGFRSVIALGTVHVSDAAALAMDEAGTDLGSILARHAAGDWEAEPDELSELRFAARHGLRLVATYRLDDEETLRIETSADRSETSVMLLRERQVIEIGLREGYDRWAERYDREPNILVAVEQPIVQDWIDALPGPPGHALDAATGTGRHALHLAKAGWRVTAFDASPGMLAAAKARFADAGLEGRIFEGSLEDTSRLPKRAFDLVICALALGHVRDLRAAVAGLAGTLHPRGTMILTDFHPAAYAIGWRADCHVLGTRYLLPHVAHTREDYLAAVEIAGLRVEEVRDLPLADAPADRLSPAGRAAVGAQELCLAIRARSA